MKPSEVLDLYDDSYAAAYDDRFLLADFPRIWAEFEVSVLRGLLNRDSQWLDVACGTGYFLSRFPGKPRAGLDLSPSMVERAIRANPDARFIRQGNYLDNVEEWHEQWTIVSCMWSAYSYVQSMGEIEQLMDNLVRWTAVGGTLFIPVLDHEDLRDRLRIVYEEPADPWGGTVALTGVTWSWSEPGTQKVHRHLVAPHLDHLVKLVRPRFARIEVIRYPPCRPDGLVRRAIVATGKRSAGDLAPAELVGHPVPTAEHAPERQLRDARDIPTAQLVAELSRRLAPWRPALWRGLKRIIFRRV
jgi:SAM-dependent methyltransferase